MAATPLSAAEFSKLLISKISFQVETEIAQSLQAIGENWSSASIDVIKTAMQQLYMRREPAVASMLKLFSKNRQMKGKLPIAAYYAKWKESLAQCLVCTNDAEKIK